MGRIAAWVAGSNEERKSQLLIKEIRSWRQFHNIQLGLDRLRRFIQFSDLIDLDAEALTLLLLSSITHQHDAKAWIHLAKSMGSSVQDQLASHLFSYFQEADLNQRLEAAEVIAQLDPAPLLRALNSPTVQSRRAALEMIGGLRLSSAVRKIASLLDDPDEECRVLACGALGAIGGSEAVKIILDATQLLNALETFCAVVRVLGRLGIPNSHLGLITTALTSKEVKRVESAKTAIAYGNSPEAVRFLLLKKLSPSSSSALWEAITAMPMKCKVRFSPIISDLTNDALLRAGQIPIGNWVGEEIEMEKLRRKLSSKFVWRSEVDRNNLLPVPCAPEVAAKVLLQYRTEAIEALAQHDRNVQWVLETLALHSSPEIRIAVLEILIQQRDRVNRAFAVDQATSMGLSDADSAVRSTACQLASCLKLWNILEKILRSDCSGKVRAGAIRGLINAPLDVIISENILRECLNKSSEPIERYWISLFVRERKCYDLLDIVRTLVWDTTTIAPSGYHKDKSWPYYDADIGETVAHAANATLATLSPHSAIWRQHVDWQHIFHADTPIM